jgi:hypothetical protein
LRESVRETIVVKKEIKHMHSVEGGRIVVAPENCVVAVGVALEESAFVEQISLNGSHANAIKRHYEKVEGRQLDNSYLYKRYWRPYVKVIIDLLEEIESLGAEVNRHCNSVKMLQNASRSPRVVIVRTHWSGDALQMQNDFNTIEELASVLGRGFDGVIDLGVCHSVEDIMPRFHKMLPDCQIVARKGECMLSSETLLLLYVLRSLKNRNRPYTTAFSEIAANETLSTGSWGAKGQQNDA